MGHITIDAVTAKKTEAQELLTLTDYLSHLKLRQAESLLGPDGRRLIREGGKFDVEPDRVTLAPNHFILEHPVGGVRVNIVINNSLRERIELCCSECGSQPCEHKGTALAYILEEK